MYLRHHIIGAIMLLASVCMASISNDQSIDNSSRQSHGSSRFHVSVKIIGGQTAQKAEFPFAATLFFLSGKEACSASIISNRHLLTAAHCTMEDAKVVSALHNRIADNKHSMIDNSVNITVSGHLPDAWNQKHVDRTFQNYTGVANFNVAVNRESVHSGTSNHEQTNANSHPLVTDNTNQTQIHAGPRSEQFYRTRKAKPMVIRAHDRLVQLGSIRTVLRKPLKIRRIHVHPDYIHDGALHDVAVIELESNIIFSDTVQPIRLLDKIFHPGDQLVAVGFGRDASGATSPTLQYLDLETPNSDLCEAGARSHPWNQNFICATATRANTGTCIGDSGGPAVVHYTKDNVGPSRHLRQVGIDSYHRNVLREGEHQCAKDGTLTYWTRIGAVLDFIVSATGLSAEELTGALDSTVTTPSEKANSGDKSSNKHKKGPSNSGKRHGVGRIINADNYDEPAFEATGTFTRHLHRSMYTCTIGVLLGLLYPVL